MNESPPLLEVSDLNIRFRAMKRHYFDVQRFVHAADAVSFTLQKGKSIGLVGESGSGKTTIARGIMQLVSAMSGDIKYTGKSIFSMTKAEHIEYRQKVQFIFQDPYSSLNPRSRAGEIVREPMDLLDVGDKENRKDRVTTLLAAVGLRSDQERLFPHQFSGGQRQRIAIARALASSPELLCCDEPVSALDVAVQAQILNLLKDLQAELNLSYLFISHDLGVIQYMCDHVIVLYLGQIVETGTASSLFANPLHPYTQALLNAIPSADPRKHTSVATIECVIQPSAVDPDPGCRYASMCSKSTHVCHTTTPLLELVDTEKSVACHNL